MTGPPPRSTVAAFAADPGSSAQARKFVRDSLIQMAIDVAIIDKVVLVVSELVTNAVLHAHAGPVITVRANAEMVRLEVEDCSESFPLLRSYSGDSTTGRGLAVVEASATWWGFESTSQGKTIWAEFTLEPELQRRYRQAGGSQGAFDSSNHALAGLEPENESSLPVHFLQVPVHPFLILEQHVRALMRELDLLRIGVATNTATNSRLPTAIYDLHVSVQEFISQELDVFGKLVRAAQDSGLSQVDISRDLTPRARVMADQFQELMQEAETLIAKGLLLTPAPQQHTTSLVRWVVTEITQQLGQGTAPQPAPSLSQPA